MILFDTSVWIDHLRHGDSALGSLRQRDVILDALNDMPRAKIATDEEVPTLIKQSNLYGVGIGYIDAHLLASARLAPGTLLWTRDKRLRAVANQLGLLAVLAH